MGDQRPSGPRGWPIVVRLARASDKEAALAFATATWHGWDYIPDVWDRWLAAVDGVVLLVTPGTGIDGSAPLDASGQPLDPDRAIAFSRVAMLAQGEAWLEGIRVDPRVRGMNVATDLQVAELHWAGAHRARIIRYFTGEQNEGSHRLGARHGFELLGAWRTYGWKDDDPMPEPVAESIDPASRAAPLGAASDAVAWWARLKDDPTLSAAGGLYEAASVVTPDADGGSFPSPRRSRRGARLAARDRRRRVAARPGRVDPWRDAPGGYRGGRGVAVDAVVPGR